MIKFKKLFPTWEHFKTFLVDYNFYFEPEVYDDKKVMLYYSLLYRQYANSHTAYDNEVFYDQLSLIIAEHFREFFKIKELIAFVSSKPLEDLMLGMETITNVAEKPNITTDSNSIVDYVGLQTRSKSRENIVDRVYNLLGKLKYMEIKRELLYYQDLFLKIIPRTYYLYDEEDDENVENI
jgi:hypothetical protein